MMKLSISLILLALCQIEAFAANQDPLNRLMEGNQRFVDGKTIHPMLMKEAKDKLVETQTPFAAIVGCSDSRVPPELIFDQGVGELFIVRDAGNVIGSIEMDSVEFAVKTLKVPLVLVLGHQNCGAVRAALSGQGSTSELDAIIPLINGALKSCEEIGHDKLVDAIRCNVKKGVEILKNSPTIAPMLAKKQVKVLGAYYEIATGKVTLIPE